MAQTQVTIRVSVAWWLRWYILGVALMCRMTGCQPNIERVAYWVRRAVERGTDADRIDPIDVFRRDGWRCHMCGKATPERLRGTYHPQAPELDHIVTLADGGTHTWGNVACACRACNGSKGARSMGQMGLGLAA